MAQEENKKELIRALTTIKDAGLMREFLEDLLSPREFTDIAGRLQIVKELKKGMTHRAIAKKLKTSIIKVSRGVRALNSGSGGFMKILKKIYGV